MLLLSRVAHSRQLFHRLGPHANRFASLHGDWVEGDCSPVRGWGADPGTCPLAPLFPIRCIDHLLLVRVVVLLRGQLAEGGPFGVLGRWLARAVECRLLGWGHILAPALDVERDYGFVFVLKQLWPLFAFDVTFELVRVDFMLVLPELDSGHAAQRELRLDATELELLRQDQVEQAFVSLDHPFAHFPILQVSVVQLRELKLKHLKQVGLDLLRLLLVELSHVLLQLCELGCIALLRFLELLTRVLAHTTSYALGQRRDLTAALSHSPDICFVQTSLPLLLAALVKLIEAHGAGLRVEDRGLDLRAALIFCDRAETVKEASVQVDDRLALLLQNVIDAKGPSRL